jgi:mono/diheme cytochrome c family protein
VFVSEVKDESLSKPVPLPNEGKGAVYPALGGYFGARLCRMDDNGRRFLQRKSSARTDPITRAAMVKKLLLVILFLLVLSPWFVIAGLIHSGLSARIKPGKFETWVALQARKFAMPQSEKDQKNPFAASEILLKEAREHFADHCAICHANDGSGNTAMGRGLSPQVPDMRLEATQSKSDGELYSIIHNGVRFTGMPAWGAESKDEDSWKLVLFIRHLPQLSRDEIKEMEKYNPKSDSERAEEQEEEDFLSGKSDGNSSKHDSHQH